MNGSHGRSIIRMQMSVKETQYRIRSPFAMLFFFSSHKKDLERFFSDTKDMKVGSQFPYVNLHDLVSKEFHLMPFWTKSNQTWHDFSEFLGAVLYNNLYD